MENHFRDTYKLVSQKSKKMIGSFLYKTDNFLSSKDGERCITSLAIITFLYIAVGNLCKDVEIEVVTIPFVSLMVISVGMHYNEHLKESEKDSKNKK